MSHCGPRLFARAKEAACAFYWLFTAWLAVPLFSITVKRSQQSYKTVNKNNYQLVSSNISENVCKIILKIL